MVDESTKCKWNTTQHKPHTQMIFTRLHPLSIHSRQHSHTIIFLELPPPPSIWITSNNIITNLASLKSPLCISNSPTTQEHTLHNSFCNYWNRYPSFEIYVYYISTIPSLTLHPVNTQSKNINHRKLHFRDLNSPPLFPSPLPITT